MVGRIGDCNCLNLFDKTVILSGLDDSIKLHNDEIEEFKNSVRRGGIELPFEREGIERQEDIIKQIKDVKQRVQDINTCEDIKLSPRRPR